jgi:hypothetical protein
MQPPGADPALNGAPGQPDLEQLAMRDDAVLICRHRCDLMVDSALFGTHPATSQPAWSV